MNELKIELQHFKDEAQLLLAVKLFETVNYPLDRLLN